VKSPVNARVKGPRQRRPYIQKAVFVLAVDILLYIDNNQCAFRYKALPNGKSIYNRIPVLRAERGLSRQDLADALSVNYQTIGYLERSDYSPSLELAFRLSDYFGLPIEAIFSRRPFRPLSEELYAQGRSIVATKSPAHKSK
jgi:DNA-binding XRE family transcriptional regulator